MKRTSVVLCLVLAASGIARAQTLKVGVFDAARLSAETELGKAVTARLNAMQEMKKSSLQAKGKEVQALQAQLDAQALSLSAEKRNALEKDIQKKSLELNQAQESARSELQMEYNDEQEKFQQKILVAIGAFSRDESFTIVLEKNAVAFADPSIDVTTALVDRFNRLFPPATSDAPKEESKDGKK